MLRSKEQAFRCIQQFAWEHIVSRKEALLCRSVHDTASRHYRITTGLAHVPQYILRLDDGAVLHPRSDMEALRRIFRSGGPGKLAQFRQRMIVSVRQLDRTARRIGKMQLAAASRQKLKRLLQDYLHAAYAANFLTPVPVAGTIIAEQLLQHLPAATPKQQQEWLALLSYPLRENVQLQEQRSLYRLVQLRQQNAPKYAAAVRRHTKQYAWIGARGYRWYLAWTVKDVDRRVTMVLRQKKSPVRELRHLDTLRRTHARATQKLLARLNIHDPEFRAYVRLAKEFAYLRTWRTDNIYGAGYHARELFRELVRRTGNKPDDAMFLTVPELEQIADTGGFPVTTKKLVLRKQGYTTLWSRHSYFVFSGSPWAHRIQRAVQQQRRRATVLRGQSAFPGTVRGIVKVVLTGDDLHKVRVGDILVAAMTFPNFIPAMEKAAAFVTDEGGILCHAAIVSREMRKPCITATKHATTTLRDGERVEVDADNGIVKKLTRK